MVLSLSTADREFCRRIVTGDEDDTSQDEAITQGADSALKELEGAIKNVGGTTPVSDSDATDQHHLALRSCTLKNVYAERGDNVGKDSRAGYWASECGKHTELVVEAYRQEPTEKSAPPRLRRGSFASEIITEESVTTGTYDSGFD